MISPIVQSFPLETPRREHNRIQPLVSARPSSLTRTGDPAADLLLISSFSSFFVRGHRLCALCLWHSFSTAQRKKGKDIKDPEGRGFIATFDLLCLFRHLAAYDIVSLNLSYAITVDKETSVRYSLVPFLFNSISNLCR